MLKTIVTFGALIAVTGPALADRLQAEADCSPSDADLTYECVFHLSRGGEPVEDAVFTVKPDMPSMPMAHNIEPVAASFEDSTGAYRAKLKLDMHGQWALRLDVSAPARDVVIIDKEFLPH
ncbi:FixH family protein [Ruegeria sediminis]|uniref:FixH family protein n=1 Tax=Ruegeria sediminis TaxID=2583820 RepID=A0ABY2WT60_9RHOB|nr:FixH family protein [Ruegeria sediminis]TMV04258.1 FixH family protein [Ruegeria sediminis]